MKGTGLTGGHVSSSSSALPPHLESDYLALCIFTNETPVPLATLQRLWQRETVQDTRQVAEQLQSCNALRMAALPDGSMWCMLTPDAYQQLQGLSSKDTRASYHQRLLTGYRKSDTAPSGSVPLSQVLDDGYIMQQVVHHLVGAGCGADIKQLLCDPDWLEAKLHAYGTTALLMDFLRYFEQVDGSQPMRLLLNALHLSIPKCLEHPEARMLRQQMLARLMAVSSNSNAWLKEWYAHQKSLFLNESAMAARAAASGASSATLSALSAERGGMLLPVHMLPRSATLQQAGGPHCMTLHGHMAPITGIVSGLRGQDVISFGEDGMAQMWDLNVGHSKLQMQESVPLTAAVTAEGGAVCVLGSASGACWMWDLNTGAVRRELQGHTGRVSLLATDRRGLRAVSFSQDDGMLLCWDLATGRCEHQLVGGGVDDSGTVQTLDMCASGMLVAAGCDNSGVHVWQLNKAGAGAAGAGGSCSLAPTPMERRRLMAGHSSWVVTVTFAGASTRLVSASHDMEARVWEASTGECLMVLSGHTGRLNHVLVDALGEDAVTSSDDGTVRIWDMNSGECRKVLQAPSETWVNYTAMSRDGKKVVAALGDHTTVMWDTSSGRCETVLEGHTESVTKVVLSQRGAMAVTFSADDGAALVWNLNNEKLSTVSGHLGKVRKMVDLAGGKVVSCSEDGSITTWDAREGLPELAFRHHSSAVNWMAVTDDGSGFVTGSGDRQVCRWQEMGVKCETVLPMQRGSRVKSMAFDGSGKRAIVALFDSTVVVWDLETGKCVADLMRRAERDGNRVHSGAVNNVYLSRDGRLAATVAKDCTARIWDVDTAVCCGVITGHQDSVVLAALADEGLPHVRDPLDVSSQSSRAGKFGGSSSSSLEPLLVTAAMDGTVCLTSLREWQRPIKEAAAKGTLVPAEGTDRNSPSGPMSGESLTLRLSIGAPPVLAAEPLQHAGAVSALSLSPPVAAGGAGGGAQRRRLAGGVDGGAGVVLWELDGPAVTGPSRTLPHSGDIGGVLFSQDGEYLVTFSAETVLMWHCRDALLVAFLAADSPISTACFVRLDPEPAEAHSPEETQVASGASSSRVAASSIVLALGDTIGSVHFFDVPVV